MNLQDHISTGLSFFVTKTKSSDDSSVREWYCLAKVCVATADCTTTTSSRPPHIPFATVCWTTHCCILWQVNMTVNNIWIVDKWPWRLLAFFFCLLFIAYLLSYLLVQEHSALSNIQLETVILATRVEEVVFQVFYYYYCFLQVVFFLLHSTDWQRDLMTRSPCFSRNNLFSPPSHFFVECNSAGFTRISKYTTHLLRLNWKWGSL